MTDNTSPTLSEQEIRSNKIKLLILILVPFVLMLVAWFIFYSGVGMPTGTSNKGTLINPPLQVNELLPEGADLVASRENLQWFFLLPSRSVCDEACEQRLYLTRQIRTALGKHTHKIQRLLLKEAGTELDSDFQALLSEEHNDLKVQDISWAKLEQALAAHDTAAATATTGGYYLADFRGFIMMYYGDQHTYKDTMKDVKFLLKYAP
ncbi:MAG: hypothetical protein AB8B48_03895 [Pseudomonadales bacterium]